MVNLQGMALEKKYTIKKLSCSCMCKVLIGNVKLKEEVQNDNNQVGLGTNLKENIKIYFWLLQ